MPIQDHKLPRGIAFNESEKVSFSSILDKACNEWQESDNTKKGLTAHKKKVSTFIQITIYYQTAHLTYFDHAQQIEAVETAGARARRVALEGMAKTTRHEKRALEDILGDDPPQHPPTPLSTMSASAGLSCGGTERPAKRQRAALATGNDAYNGASGPIKDALGELSSIMNAAEAARTKEQNQIAAERLNVERARLHVEEDKAATLKLISGKYFICASSL